MGLSLSTLNAGALFDFLAFVADSKATTERVADVVANKVFKAIASPFLPKAPVTKAQKLAKAKAAMLKASKKTISSPAGGSASSQKQPNSSAPATVTKLSFLEKELARLQEEMKRAAIAVPRHVESSAPTPSFSDRQQPSSAHTTASSSSSSSFTFHRFSTAGTGAFPTSPSIYPTPSYAVPPASEAPTLLTSSSSSSSQTPAPVPPPLPTTSEAPSIPLTSPLSVPSSSPSLSTTEPAPLTRSDSDSTPSTPVISLPVSSPSSSASSEPPQSSSRRPSQGTILDEILSVKLKPVSSSSCASSQQSSSSVTPTSTPMSSSFTSSAGQPLSTTAFFTVALEQKFKRLNSLKENVIEDYDSDHGFDD